MGRRENERIEQLTAQRDQLLELVSRAQLVKWLREFDTARAFRNMSGQRCSKEDAQLLFKGCFESLNESIPGEVGL